jgi:hypothetical protein
MHPDLEEDFRNQQTRLRALALGRRSLPDGCYEALKVDLQIIVARNLIRSYEGLESFGP